LKNGANDSVAKGFQVSGCGDMKRKKTSLTMKHPVQSDVPKLMIEFPRKDKIRIITKSNLSFDNQKNLTVNNVNKDDANPQLNVRPQKIVIEKTYKKDTQSIIYSQPDTVNTEESITQNIAIKKNMTLNSNEEKLISNVVIRSDTIEEVRPKTDFKSMYRLLEIEHKHDAQKVVIDNNGSEKYFNALDNLDHEMEIETKKEMIRSKLYYEDNDLEAYGIIHCSKENNRFKKKKESKTVEVQEKKSSLPEQLNN
jgi:uncharacterized protein YrzB (UPF0473 family)